MHLSLLEKLCFESSACLKCFSFFFFLYFCYHSNIQHAFLYFSVVQFQRNFRKLPGMKTKLNPGKAQLKRYRGNSRQQMSACEMAECMFGYQQEVMRLCNCCLVSVPLNLYHFNKRQQAVLSYTFIITMTKAGN